jgi:acyl-CoA synthetase (AMP-forming)/AMP-acid ligase II
VAAPGPDEPSGLQVSDLLFAWAQRIPDKPALVHNGVAVSYAELAHRVAQARGWFARNGLSGPGIAVLATRHLLEFWIQALALRSLGLTTISPRDGDTLETLALPDARGIIGSATGSRSALEADGEAAGLPCLSPSIIDEPPFWPTATRSVEQAGGHILLTSGTTGLPKKVLSAPSFEPAYIHHRRSIMGFPHNYIGVLFDFGAWTGAGYRGVVCTLTAGATMILQQGGRRYEPLRYPGVTSMAMVPTMAAELLATPSELVPRNPAMEIQVGAGALNAWEIEALKERFTPHLFTAFGSTEARVTAFTPLLTPEDYRWHRLVPGRGAQVVDDEDRPLPAGRIGRLRVPTTDGPTGYLHDEAATRAFFKDGYFYSGDLAEFSDNGRMAVHGRVTDVINWRGQKILPLPIEERLREILQVGGVCLFSMPNDAGEEEIHAVLETRTPIEPARLRDALRSELAGYEGAHVHFTPALPRNDNGKILRQETRERALAAARARAG